jgi:glucose/arabinose dehydrogenase
MVPTRRFGLEAKAIVMLVIDAVTAALASGAEPLPVSVPADFRIEIFADGLGAPRALTVDPAGVLLVSLPADGRIVALPPRRGENRTSGAVTVAARLDRPHGLTFHRGRLYVAETGRVRRFRYDPVARTAREPVTVVAHLPAGLHHWTRSIAFGPDGNLYVAVGSSCDTCREVDRRRAAILRYNADGSGERIFAEGFRNPVGLAFHPRTRALWTTVNERDWREGGAPPDLITEVRRGAAYGWPDCFASGRTFVVDREFGGGSCRPFTLPTLEIPPHSAPLGHAFYTGRRFPEAYRGSLFVALHGSRQGVPPAGYKVVRVVFERGVPMRLEDFATGWRSGDRVWGRPVDVVTGTDGALYISDDHGGRVYRVTAFP